jgi:2-methylfumaryl-CoA isomerase
MIDTTATAAPGAAARPLESLRILDLSTYVAGPSGAMTLGQLGADVIRIDPMGGATDVRRLPLDSKGNSLYWAGLNKAKRSAEIDTSTAEGRDLVMAMLAVPGGGNGIMITNAVGQRWLEYDELVRHRPDAIQVHISGLSDGTPAVDYTVNCEVGLPLITGPAELDRPVNHVLPAWDLLTGLHAAIAILTSERIRARTGRGQRVQLSLADVAVATMCHLGFVGDVAVNGHARLREGNYLYGSFGCDFATADGERVMVVALTQRHWRNLVKLTGIHEAITALEHSLDVDLAAEEMRYRYREVLAALIRPWFEQRSLADVITDLESSQVLWGRYRSLEDFVGDPASLLHMSHLVEEVEHAGIGRIPTPRSVLNFPGIANESPASAPTVGQHTSEVLRELLGIDDAQVEDLQRRGVVGGRR